MVSSDLYEASPYKVTERYDREREALESEDPDRIWGIYLPWVEAAAKRRAWEALKWEESEAFFNGHFYVKADFATLQLKSQTRLKQYGFSLPIVRPAVMGAAGRLGSQYLVPEGIPASPDPDDIAAASIVSTVLQSYHESMDVPKINDRLIIVLLVLGNAFKCTYWDPTAMAQIMADPNSYRTAMGESGGTDVGMMDMPSGRQVIIEAPVGNLRQELTLPWNVYTQSNLQSFEQSTRFARVFYRPVSYLKMRYPEIAHLIEPEYIAHTKNPVEESPATSIAPYSPGADLQGSTQYTEDSQICRQYEFFELTEDNKWRRYNFVRVKDNKGAWVNANEAPHPINPLTHYSCFPSISGMWGESYVHEMKQPQRSINRIYSEVMWSAHRAPRPTILAARSSNLSPVTNEIANILYYEAAAGPKPDFVDHKPFDPRMLDLINFVKQFVYSDIAAQNEITRSVSDPNRISGTAVDKLQAGDQQRYVWIDRQFQYAEKMEKRKELTLLKTFAQERRLARIVSDRERPSISTFSAPEFGATEDVLLRQKSPLPETKAELWNVALQLANSGLLTDAKQAEMRRLEEFVGMGATALGRSTSDPDEDMAKAENQWIETGQATLYPTKDPNGQPIQDVVIQRSGSPYPIFHDRQDDARHLEFHYKVLRSPRFVEWSGQAQGVHMAHVVRHEQSFQEKQQAAQQQMVAQQMAAQGAGMPSGQPELSQQPEMGQQPEPQPQGAVQS